MKGGLVLGGHLSEDMSRTNISSGSAPGGHFARHTTLCIAMIVYKLQALSKYTTRLLHMEPLTILSMEQIHLVVAMNF